MTTLKDPETVYFAADEAAGQIIEQLRAPDTTRADRARLLHELADLEERMGVAQAAAWPEDQTPDEDGFTPLQSRTLSALTLHYLAAAEDAASRGPRKRAPHSWEVAAGPLLDEYAAAGGPG
ncbi:MAG TPA: hypothetical protein VK659_09750, partial [Asanoa sp.]|nr:hypothetical protein [Asanoa sp.]